MSAVNNTTDLNKPVSNATQTALNLKLNVGDKATQTEALVGTDDAKWMTPLKTAQAITAAVTVTSVAGRTGEITLSKSDVGLSNVDDTSDLAKPLSNAVIAALVGKQNVAGRGVANGYAGLDSSARVPLAQIPAFDLPVSNAVAAALIAASVTYSLVSPLALGSSNAVGVANVAAREDHVHQFPLARISQTPWNGGTLSINDHGGVVEWTSGGSVYPLNLPNNLPAGFNCLVRVVSANGAALFTPLSGATVRQADGLYRTRKQWSEVSVSVRSNTTGTNAEYVLSGDLT